MSSRYAKAFAAIKRVVFSSIKVFTTSPRGASCSTYPPASRQGEVTLFFNKKINN